jgi:hypothetical protein
MKLFAPLLACALCIGISVSAQTQKPQEGKSNAATPAAGPPPGAAPVPAPGPPGVPGSQKPSENEEETLPPPGTLIDQPFAILQALDKISARVRRLPVKVGAAAPFGTLSIEVDACRKAPPEDPPQSAAFLKITDTRPGEAARVVFSGWMFASSPALSAMDHPVYDIWVVDCSSASTASPAPAQ